MANFLTVEDSLQLAAGIFNHVICRGIERGVIFEDNADRDDFVNRLGIHQSSVSRAVERGKRIASKEGLHLM